MKHPKRRLYEKNSAPYGLMLLFIVGNGLYAVTALNRMDATSDVGLIVMVTIVLFLLGFLTAVKIRAYSIQWSVGALLIGVFQTARFFVALSDATEEMILPTVLYLLGSGIACVVAGAWSTVGARQRELTIRGIEERTA